MRGARAPERHVSLRCGRGGRTLVERLPVRRAEAAAARTSNAPQLAAGAAPVAAAADGGVIEIEGSARSTGA
jgi:hypothetical protein